VVLSAEEREAYIQQIIADRVPDLLSLLDALLEGAAGDVAGQVDSQRIGLVGWSFGGWAVLSTLEVDQRPGAVVALVPGGSSNPLPGIIPCTLTFAWQREVPALYLAAEYDQYTPLPGQFELFERTPSANKQLFILRGADHLHFGDQVDEPGACPAEQAHAFTRSLSLAHFDATLKARPEAQDFLRLRLRLRLRPPGPYGADSAPHT
jgi:predicted dienelactone hydrolase